MKDFPGKKHVTKVVSLTAIPLAAMMLLSGCHPDGKAPAVPPNVMVSHPVAQNVNDVDVYAGRFEAINTVDVRPRVSGYLEKVAFRDGAIVNKGDLLFVIDPRRKRHRDRFRPRHIRILECQ